MSAQFPDEQTPSGEFERQADVFRSWVRQDETSGFLAEAGRYHLYLSLACPWASRTLIVLKLKGLESTIGTTVLDPIRDERGWAFREGPGYSRDPINGFEFLSEAYELSQSGYQGRVTVPVLWDMKKKVIVNNSEDDICRMFDQEFRNWARPGVELFPKAVAEEQDRLSEHIYETINNGVYRAGFATSQEAYEKAVRGLFAALDQLEDRLRTRRFLFGTRIVETDWRLFCTLIRFDAVYHGHFKCNLRRIVDYPNLSGYLRDLYQQPGIAETVNFDHIKRHYYVTHREINPTGIVPAGPILELSQPANREHLGGGDR